MRKSFSLTPTAGLVLLIICTLMADLGLAAINYLSMVTIGNKNSPQILLSTTGRDPAAIINPNNDQSLSPQRMLDALLDCEAQQSIKLNEDVQQLRLKGTLCEEEIQLEDLRIVNLTNQFASSLFAVSNHRYTTDYISLAKGNNIIVLSVLLKNGNLKPLAHIRVERN